MHWQVRESGLQQKLGTLRYSITTHQPVETISIGSACFRNFQDLERVLWSKNKTEMTARRITTHALKLACNKQ